jgi:hypothetical protein
MPERTWKWSSKIFFPDSGAAPLDWGTELWNWNVSAYDSAPAIADALQRAGRAHDDNDVLYYATRTQLMDVVDAAGGVERAHTRFQRSMVHAQQVYEQWSKQPGRVPALNTGLSDASVEDAWYSVDELIIWTRILLDRLRRGSVKQRGDDQGLIPAMARGPRPDAVIRARSRLLSSRAGETRYLAGLNLHMQPLRPGSRSARVFDGKVALPFPDPVSRVIDHQVQLTYDDGRDAATFADEVLDAVARFMNEIIAAFEQYIPARFKRPDGAQK